LRRLGKNREKTDRGEPEASVASFFSSSFYGAFRRRLVLRGWGGELLLRDNRQEEEEKRDLSACRYIPTGTD
jgi:hypothetical protein